MSSIFSKKLKNFMWHKSIVTKMPGVFSGSRVSKGTIIGGIICVLLLVFFMGVGSTMLANKPWYEARFSVVDVPYYKTAASFLFFGGMMLGIVFGSIYGGTAMALKND
jgi:uncharacterized membrane protein